MTEVQNKKTYDLEERTMKFAHRVNTYVKALPRDIPNIENGKQLVRAAGSVGANYIEANESLSRKDFFMRIRISRKESKEARYWLGLSSPVSNYENEKLSLIQEATELMLIFGSIVTKANASALKSL